MKIFIKLFCLLLLTHVCFANEASFVTVPEVAWQGKTIAVYLPKWTGEVRQGEFLGQRFKIYDNEINYVGYIGIPINASIGKFPVTIYYSKDGTSHEAKYDVPVVATNFPLTRFTLSPSRNKLRAPSIVANDWEQVEKVILKESDKRLWEGKFSVPVTAPVSMSFGHREIINGKKAGNHRGVDLAAISGTKVLTPNNGVVVFAKKLKAYGGTVVVDHGQGIYTIYFHLSSFISKVGDPVEKGQPIALSGNSGISSGAHLHWAFSVHNLRVDPLQWVNNEF